MKYMITNGNSYINVVKLDPCAKFNPLMDPYCEIDKLSCATRMKLEQAKCFIKNRLNGDPRWGIRKIARTVAHKNYVITTGINYVSKSPKYQITPNYEDVKWFKSVADAESYLNHNRHIFDNPIIIGEDGELPELDQRRTFTPEQLQILGVEPPPKPTKRVVLSKTTRDIVYENGGGVCAICGRPIDRDSFTIDHIVPLCRGGKNELSNLQIACSDCNRLKGGRMNSEFSYGLANILSRQLQENPNEDLTAMLIRSIVRGKIDSIKESGVC